jgi:hypothetical protein
MRHKQLEPYLKGSNLSGLSLRDHFAIMALQGILANTLAFGEDDSVEKAYRLADNMLVYRDQTQY